MVSSLFTRLTRLLERGMDYEDMMKKGIGMIRCIHESLTWLSLAWFPSAKYCCTSRTGPIMWHQSLGARDAYCDDR